MEKVIIHNNNSLYSSAGGSRNGNGFTIGKARGLRCSRETECLTAAGHQARSKYTKRSWRQTGRRCSVTTPLGKPSAVEKTTPEIGGGCRRWARSTIRVYQTSGSGARRMRRRRCPGVVSEPREESRAGAMGRKGAARFSGPPSFWCGGERRRPGRSCPDGRFADRVALGVRSLCGIAAGQNGIGASCPWSE